MMIKTRISGMFRSMLIIKHLINQEIMTAEMMIVIKTKDQIKVMQIMRIEEIVMTQIDKYILYHIYCPFLYLYLLPIFI